MDLTDITTIIENEKEMGRILKQKGETMKYSTWTITNRTMSHLSPEHRDILRRMLSQLLKVYDICEEKERDFRQVFTLLSAFRDIIMAWPLDEFNAAYDELSEWQQSFMGGF